MKILVVTDSHNNFKNLLKAYEKEIPDIVLCAGDHSTDVEELSYVKEETKYYIVRGNCDFYDKKHKDLLEIKIQEKKILLVHGHLFSVKSDYRDLEIEAKKRKVDLVVFGHTHIPYLKEGETKMFNPGALKDDLYGIIELKNDKMNIEFKKL